MTNPPNPASATQPRSEASHLSLTRAGLARAASRLGWPGLIVIFVIKDWMVLWGTAGSPGSFFAGDLPTLVAAAKRLVETGSPYSRELVNGPLVRDVDTIQIGYFYPPPIAQLFVPLRAIDFTQLAVGWALAQVFTLGFLLVAVSVVASGRYDRNRALAALALGLASYPFQFAMYGGNLSGWVAAGVAVMLLGSGRLAGIAAALTAVVKMIPAPLALAAAVAPGSRRAVVAVALGFVAGSFALSPAAWAAWWSVLPNIVPPEPGGVSPGAILRGTSFVGIATAVAFAISGAFLLASVLRARRWGMDRTVVVCAVGSYLFVSTVLWEHYLAVLVPLMIAAWPSATRWQRAAIIIGAVIQALPWFWDGAAMLVGADVAATLLAPLELAGALVVLVATAYPNRPLDRALVTASSASTGGA